MDTSVSVPKKINFSHERRKRGRAITRFWKAFKAVRPKGKNGNNARIELLRSMAEVTFAAKKSARDRRNAFDANKWTYFALKRPCSVCRSPADVRHHIIQLQNGGHNGGINLMRLCKTCHAEIHPWLKT